MPRIFITAFEPYDGWRENSSWLTLVEFTKEMAGDASIVTRLYPVDLEATRERLAVDLRDDYDYALHLGQAPGSSVIQLEAVGLNIGGSSLDRPEDYRPIVEDGPVAYRSTLPLADWAKRLRGESIPASVSYHAGTYLCNAMLYLSLHFIGAMQLRTQACFVHVPLDVSQTAQAYKDVASLPATLSGRALRVIVEELVTREQLRARELA